MWWVKRRILLPSSLLPPTYCPVVFWPARWNQPRVAKASGSPMLLHFQATRLAKKAIANWTRPVPAHTSCSQVSRTRRRSNWVETMDAFEAIRTLTVIWSGPIFLHCLHPMMQSSLLGQVWLNLTHTIILHFSLRILVTGAAANFTSVSNLVGNVFNAHVFVLLNQVDSAQISPHRNAPAQEYRSWASLGGGYVTQWVWGCEWGSGCSSGKSVSAVSTRCLWGEAIVRQALLKMLQW